MSKINFDKLREEFSRGPFTFGLRTLQVGQGRPQGNDGLAVTAGAQTLRAILEKLSDFGLPVALDHGARISESRHLASGDGSSGGRMPPPAQSWPLSTGPYSLLDHGDLHTGPHDAARLAGTLKTNWAGW